MNWQHTLGMLYCILHLGTSTLFNVRHLLPDTVPILSSSTVTEWTEQVCSTPGLRQVAQLTGLHGGYGFYSPSVGSSYHSVFALHHPDTGSDRQWAYPDLQHHSSRVRYRSLLDLSGGWVSRDQGADRAPIRPLAEALATCICRQVSARHPSWQVSCTYMMRIVSPRQHIILFETQTIRYAYHQENRRTLSLRSTPVAHRHRPVACRRDDESMA